MKEDLLLILEIAVEPDVEILPTVPAYLHQMTEVSQATFESSDILIYIAFKSSNLHTM